jgi:hypothetical protein
LLSLLFGYWSQRACELAKLIGKLLIGLASRIQVSLCKRFTIRGDSLWASGVLLKGCAGLFPAQIGTLRLGQLLDMPRHVVAKCANQEVFTHA